MLGQCENYVLAAVVLRLFLRTCMCVFLMTLQKRVSF